MKQAFISHVESNPTSYGKKIINLVWFAPIYTAIAYVALHGDVLATSILSVGVTIFSCILALSTKH